MGFEWITPKLPVPFFGGAFLLTIQDPQNISLHDDGNTECLKVNNSVSTLIRRGKSVCHHDAPFPYPGEPDSLAPSVL